MDLNGNNKNLFLNNCGNGFPNHYQYNYINSQTSNQPQIYNSSVQYYQPSSHHSYYSSQSNSKQQQPSPQHQIVYSPPQTPPLHSASNSVSPRTSYHLNEVPVSYSSYPDSDSTMVPSYHSSPSLYSQPHFYHHHASHNHHHSIHISHHQSPNVRSVIIPKIEIPPRCVSPQSQTLVSPSTHPPVLNLNDSSENINNNIVYTPKSPTSNSNDGNNKLNSDPNSTPSSPVLSPKSNNKISEIISGLIPICNELNCHDQVQNKAILNKLQESIEDALKEIKKIKKTRLPYPKPQTSLKDNEEKIFLSLRPRRNRKCTNKTKTLNPNSSEEIFCLACGTTKSPEWRKGPDGCKSLCNACGLYYAKTKKKENEISCQPELLPKLMKINNLIND